MIDMVAVLVLGFVALWVLVPLALVAWMIVALVRDIGPRMVEHDPPETGYGTVNPPNGMGWPDGMTPDAP